MNGVVFTLSEEAGLVCRMEVDNRKSKLAGEYEGATHNFSSLSSRRESGEKPEKYALLYGPRR